MVLHRPVELAPFFGSYTITSGLPTNLSKSCIASQIAIMSGIMRSDTPIGFPKLWTIAGYLVSALATLFVGRIVYEETMLTWTNGPQMVGFSMMHGGVPLILLAGLIGLPGALLWMLGSLVLLYRRQFRIPPVNWFPMGLLIFLGVMLFVPYETWEEFMVRTAGPGSHGSEFLVQAAAQDKQSLVTLLLRKGYDVNQHADIAEYLSSRFHCKESIVAQPCVDSAFSACVH